MARAARGASGKRGRGKRKRLPDRGELRGAEREEQVRALVRERERADREQQGALHPLLDLGGWISGVPVPAWSRRELMPGEWREGATRPVASKRRLEPSGGTTRATRRRLLLLAHAAGIGDLMDRCDGHEGAMGRGGGRRLRMEEGADVSGVT